MVRLFSPGLWKQVNDHFRASGQFYVEAPRPRAYARKQRHMYQRFPQDENVFVQAAFLAKNLVNLQRYPDANKRTASVLLEVFLESNGYELRCDDEEYATFLLRVQHKVPPAYWDGRSFSLKLDLIPWRNDAYHQELRAWFRRHTVRKS